MKVELLGIFGDDSTIVESARISFNKEDKTDHKQNEKLIRYLMKNKHTSPFEMVEYRFKIHCPIFVARQIVRHRTASINELSGRYTEYEPEYFIPDLERIKGKGILNKQGSEGEVSEFAKKNFRKKLESNSEKCHKDYGKFLNLGISNELARMTLPVNTYTTFIWKIDLHNLFHLRDWSVLGVSNLRVVS